jgi:hypothetical protein
MLPCIGENITAATAVSLCRDLGLDDLAARIETAPERYGDWRFDGCSGLPDRRLGALTGCNWKDITYRCCLPHDLRYAYGKPGDQRERERADKTFYHDLIAKAGMQKWLAAIFFVGVRIGGIERLKLPFSWAFAHGPEK